MAHVTFPKPRRGDALLARRQKRGEQIAAEQRVMRAALKRDHGKCRWPKCEFATFKLPIDPAHFLQHRGAGGNPKGDRTETTGQILALCRRHHDALDIYGEIEIEPMDAERLADGPLSFYRRDPVTGRMECFATEKAIGIYETRGA